MGNARNLKLKATNVGAKVRAQGAIIFLCGPNVELIQLLYASKRRGGVQRQSSWYRVWGSKGEAEAEAVLAFKR